MPHAALRSLHRNRRRQRTGRHLPPHRAAHLDRHNHLPVHGSRAASVGTLAEKKTADPSCEFFFCVVPEVRRLPGEAGDIRWVNGCHGSREAGGMSREHIGLARRRGGRRTGDGPSPPNFVDDLQRRLHFSAPPLLRFSLCAIAKVGCSWEAGRDTAPVNGSSGSHQRRSCRLLHIIATRKCRCPHRARAPTEKNILRNPCAWYRGRA